MTDPNITKDDLKAVINQPAAQSLWQKIKTWLQTTKFPTNFFYDPNAVDPFNPTLSELQRDSNQTLWDRIKVFLTPNPSFYNLPYWIVFVPLLGTIIYFGKNALIFFIEIISQFIFLIPLAVILGIIWYKFRK